MSASERLSPRLPPLLISAICLVAAAQGPRNLLYNPEADFSNAAWIPAGDAIVEPCGGNPCFALRNHGSFQQTVTIPRDLAGHFVVVIASAASERVNGDGSITGLPSLYGLMIAEDGGRILAYLQGQHMLARPPAPNVWVKVWGIFPIPAGTHLLAVDLHQAERANSPQNGSAARFDNVGAYVFPTEAEANAFVAAWTGSRKAKGAGAG